MSNSNIILSVMVISHNQVHLIGRCLDSILRQRIRVPWEIVISDDASTDGTWEWIQEAAKLRKEEIGLRMKEIRGEVLDGEFIPEITCSQINSSDYNPTVTSDRCAANKANVYSLARGKYCVNIDADDYLLGDDIYQYQIDQLEAHPECSVAVQNIWYQNDGEPLEKGHSWHPKNIWKENEVICVDEYFKRKLCISNPAFMMRRDECLTPTEKYGLLFDDPIITTHHVGRGKIICSQRAQYVYVQYRNSIWNQVGHDESDNILRNIVGLIISIRFFPKYKKLFLEADVHNWIVNLKRILAQEGSLQPTKHTNAYLNRLHNRCLERILRGERMYIRLLLNLALVINKTSSFDGLMAAIFFYMIGEAKHDA